MVLLTAATLMLMGGTAMAGPIELIPRQSCPAVHVFGARETTVSPGYGSSSYVVNAVLSAYSGSTAEAITYPACGGQSSCGSVSYANSAQQGTAAVASAVNAFNQKCPDTILVLVGYSQGGQIMDNAFCGGGDSYEGISNTAVQISSAAVAKIAAAIFMGDPRYIYGLSYEVGTCRAQGFAPRPAGFSCPNASKIQSYCDAADPYCCTGNDSNTHQGYGQEYGSAALTFIKAKISALQSGTGTGGGTTSPTTTSSSPARTTTAATGGGSTGGSCSSLYGQCGGIGWTGPTCCSSGTCKSSNAYYSQCL